jgi:hypothetical protein
MGRQVSGWEEESCALELHRSRGPRDADIRRDEIRPT